VSLGALALITEILANRLADFREFARFLDAYIEKF
jgi:hypothetical protein